MKTYYDKDGTEIIAGMTIRCIFHFPPSSSGSMPSPTTPLS